MWTEGQVLQSGKYQVIRRIGGGGFGLTYLAADAFFNRQVVIKTPNDTFEADQDYERYVRRFQREGQTLAKLKHPNIVSVIGFFKELGVPCLVMAYVEGVTLHERLRSGEPLAEGEAVEIFRKLAVALHQVHTAGIFHCDIHPGNIMLQQNGEPVLIDFGSAKLLQPTTMTVTTTVNQSFSPYEQQNPKNQPKATLDVYGLAATLFFAVTGTKPTAAITRKLYGDAFEFSPILKSTLNSWLREAILKGMALEEQNRPSNMKAFEKLLCSPQTESTARVPIQEIVLEKQPQKQRQKTSEVLQRATYRSSVKIPPKKQSAFPWMSLMLFLFGNVPTGACLWLLGNSPDIDTDAWTLVFGGFASVVLAGVVGYTVVLPVSLTVGLAMFGSGALAGVWCGALAGSVAWAWAWASSWLVALALVWAVIGSLCVVAAVSGAEAWVSPETWSTVWAAAEAKFWLWLLALAGLLSAYKAGNDAHDIRANWAGIGGSSNALAVIMSGLSMILLDDAELRTVIIVFCFLQTVLLLRSLKSATNSLSILYASKIQSFIILNAACVLGMLGGAVLAWWLSSMNTAA